MNDTTCGALGDAAILVEAILCDDRLYSSPRELVLCRVRASFAADAAEGERHLLSAARLADAASPYSWRDAMRSHFELAEARWQNGNYSGCAAELTHVLEILERYFSPGNHGMAAMHRLRAACLRAVGCELGACHADSLAERMERGGRSAI